MTTMTPVKSSNIESIGYNENEKQLLVKFKNGKTFSYKYVTYPEYEALLNADSVGSHFSKFIKNTKAAQEVIVEELPDKNSIINELKDRLESVLAHIVMIERIATRAPVDQEVLALTKSALEIDKAKSNV